MVFGIAAAGGGQRTLGIQLIHISADGRIIFEVLTCAVCVLPDVVAGKGRPLINTLMIIGTPAIAHAKAVVALIVGVVDGIDGNGHTVAGKAQPLMHPHEVAGVVIGIIHVFSAAPHSLSRQYAVLAS